MTDNLKAVTTIAHCVDCNSSVHPVNRPGGILAIEVQHSTPCPAWPHDRRETALVLYGSGGDPAEDGWTAEVGVGEAPGVPPEKGDPSAESQISPHGFSTPKEQP